MTPASATYVALDLETTGLSRQDDRIVEVGAVRFLDDGREVDRFERLVNPGRPSGPRARAVHGIDDAVLARAEPASIVLPAFLAWIGDPRATILMAHNASFDACFLGAEFGRLGLATAGHAVLDTLGLARRHLAHLPGHRLDFLASHFNLDPHGPHRALADSRRVMGLWLALGGPALLTDPVAPPAYPIFDPSGPEPAPLGWERLVEAADRGWPVRLIYAGGTRGETPRDVTPRRFLHKGGVAYVASLCHLDAKEKQFRLDRVRSYEVLGPVVG